MRKLAQYTFTTLLLILTGIMLLIAFIWYRFLRERLPREIPFNLNEYGSIILISICSMYLFTVITLLISFKANNNVHINTIIDSIYKH